MSLRVFLLGPMRAYVRDTPLKLPPRSKLVSLWGHLLVHRDRAIPRSLLAFTFWPDESEPEARLNLRRHLHRLQQLLPAAPVDRPWILTEGSSLQWNPSADGWLDLAEFERLTRQPDRQPEAVDLYGGDLLEGVYDDWVFGERERVRELCLQVLHGVVDQAEEANDHRQAILYAQRLLRHDPLREETYRALMRLHARSGDRAGVVRNYNACTTVLDRELGVEPSAETTRAYHEHLAQHSSSEPEPVAPPTAHPSARNNLPDHLTSFVGRSREVETVHALLKTTRLLSLTGIGGVGKTRLALAVAEAALPHYPDGAWWVDLAPLSDPSLLEETVAAAMGLREQSTRPISQVLAEAVRFRSMLLVLDNCEHLVAGCAALVRDLLKEGANLRILTTSTEPLSVPGEMVWQVPPLELPASGITGEALDAGVIQATASVLLFMERATAALPTFRLTPANLPAVVRLCQALDGIPLALELAAGRLKMLSVDQLVERLDDRFRVLAGGKRTTLSRHRTLGAVLDWSYALLTEDERALFRRLSLFFGGFTLESAEAVSAGPPLALGQVLQVLSELVDKSLVTVSRADPARVRYGLLETVGHYARERLLESDEAQQVRAAYARFFLDLVEAAGERLLRGPDQEKWFWIIGQEYANLRSLMSYAETSGDFDSLARIASRLWPFWWTHGHLAEGRRWLEIILPGRASLPEGLRASVLHATGRLMALQGDGGRARALLEENLEVCRMLGDRPRIADALTGLGVVASNEQDYDRADELWAEAFDVYASLGDQWGVARASNNRGDLLVYRGDYPGAISHLQKSVQVFRELRSTLGESISLINLGRASLLQGEPERAERYFRDSLDLKIALADQEGIAWNLEGLAGVAGAVGQAERAARLFGAAESLRKAISIPLAAPDLPLYERIVAQSKRGVDPERWQACWLEGTQLDTERALAYAQSPVSA